MFLLTYWGATGDAERTKDKIKLWPGVLGAQMETHNSLVTSFLYQLFFYFDSFLLHSLRPYFFTIL
jgi:hypothetical protein